MACDKRYGLRQVWVKGETTVNEPVTFAAADFLWSTGSNFPAMYRELLEVNEAVPGRGKTLDLRGAQNELAWDVTCTLPRLSNFANVGNAIASLFWAAGSNVDALANILSPINTTGEQEDPTCVVAFKNGPVCGRTLQIAGLDRDGQTLEILTGCIVSQIVLAFSTSEVCTIQFSGVAARKAEFSGFSSATAPAGATTVAAGVCRTSYDAALKSTTSLSGVDLVSSEGYTAAITDAETGKITVGTWSTAPAASNSYHYALPFPSTKPSAGTVAPTDWSLYSLEASPSKLPCTGLTWTIESGLSYGAVTTEKPWPTVIQSGMAKASGSLSVFYTNDTAKAVQGYLKAAPGEADNKFLMIQDNSSATKYYICEMMRFNEAPVIDLSSVDEAAQVEIPFTCYESSTIGDTYPFLDIFYIDEY